MAPIRKNKHKVVQKNWKDVDVEKSAMQLQEFPSVKLPKQTDG